MTRTTPAATAYYANPRADVLRHVPKHARSILDVGCGAGALGAGIKRRQPARVVGVEYVAEQAECARAVLDTVHVGDVAAIELPYAPGSFDCLIYCDVLEHLVDPWATLARHRPLLAPGGTLLVSLPNVQFIGVITGLLRGRWEYRQRGIMDRTHLRFFTRRSAAAMIAGAGYMLTAAHRNFRWFDNPDSSLHRYARIAAPLPWVRDLLTYQYIFVARPPEAR
jgi:2-polyprenyl-3-methyl-5-hydroxy-6-metoxy-1,4-benzoquinol methylase